MLLKVNLDRGLNFKIAVVRTQSLATACSLRRKVISVIIALFNISDTLFVECLVYFSKLAEGEASAANICFLV